MPEISITKGKRAANNQEQIQTYLAQTNLLFNNLEQKVRAAEITSLNLSRSIEDFLLLFIKLKKDILKENKKQKQAISDEITVFEMYRTKLLNELREIINLIATIVSKLSNSTSMSNRAGEKNLTGILVEVIDNLNLEKDELIEMINHLQSAERYYKDMSEKANQKKYSEKISAICIREYDFILNNLNLLKALLNIITKKQARTSEKGLFSGLFSMFKGSPKSQGTLRDAIKNTHQRILTLTPR